MRQPKGPRAPKLQATHATVTATQGAEEALADIAITDLAIHAKAAFGAELGGMTEDGRPWPDFWAGTDKERDAWRAAVMVTIARHKELTSKQGDTR